MRIIPTIPPYAPFLKDLASHALIQGFRLNTVMPVHESLEELLKRLQLIVDNKEIWIDLKCRQIRTSHGAFFNPIKEPRIYELHGEKYILDPSNPKVHGELNSPPWAVLKIDRKIKLDFSDGPIRCWFQDGYDKAYICAVEDGDTLIMLDGPRRVVGGGESINILHPSLEIEGYLTPRDVQYIEAAKSVGIHTYMPSYVESNDDVKAILELDPDAEIIAKVESEKGLEWVRTAYKSESLCNLMAARGDLYVETAIRRPERILWALETIVRNDCDAVVASRILTSLRESSRPTCSDITDIYAMIEMGYARFMVGDDICFNENSIMLALDIMKAIDDGHDDHVHTSMADDIACKDDTPTIEDRSYIPAPLA